MPSPLLGLTQRPTGIGPASRPYKRPQLLGNGGIQPSTTQAADSQAPDCTWENVQPTQMVLTLCPNCFYPHNSFQRRQGCTGKGEAFVLDKVKCRVGSCHLCTLCTAPLRSRPGLCSVCRKSGASGLWAVLRPSLYPGPAEPPAQGRPHTMDKSCRTSSPSSGTVLLMTNDAQAGATGTSPSSCSLIYQRTHRKDTYQLPWGLTAQQGSQGLACSVDGHWRQQEGRAEGNRNERGVAQAGEHGRAVHLLRTRPAA